MPDPACIGLGSNLGDRLSRLRQALEDLEGIEGVSIAAVSSVYESDPMGYLNQPPFLNAAAALHCRLEPAALLAGLFSIEARHGRQRTVPWGPRTLDLDLLLWGHRVVADDGLELPHPRLLERDFVLVPLLEIAPDLVHPVTGRRLADHAAELAAGSNLRNLGPLRPTL